MKRLWWFACVVGAVSACGNPRGGMGAGDDTGGHDDAASDTLPVIDTAVIPGDDALPGDGGGTVDGSGTTDGGGATDGGIADAVVITDAPTGPLTGGPCASGHAGVTAYRIRWAGNGAGSTAYPVYEKNGLPDHSRDHAGAFGYQIGFTPRWDDPFLGDGGLVLDGSDFVDLELTTVGLATISNATLSIRGRSFNTTSPGGFSWQTFDGSGATPSMFVSNSAPYQWYSADMTTEISPGDNHVLVRIKAAGGSGSLIVNRIELCFTAT